MTVADTKIANLRNIVISQITRTTTAKTVVMLPLIILTPSSLSDSLVLEYLSLCLECTK